MIVRQIIFFVLIAVTEGLRGYGVDPSQRSIGFLVIPDCQETAASTGTRLSQSNS